MNNLTINGNLVKDMEIKDVKGLLIGEFTIANNQRVGKDKEETTFLKCTLFGSRVESLEKFLVKGAKVLVNGRLSITNVADVEKTDGYKTYVSCIVDNLEIEKFVEPEEQPKKLSKYNKYKK